MPRPDFFKDIQAKHRSEECRAGKHPDCPLEVVLGDPIAYPPKIKPCTCACHDPAGVYPQHERLILHPHAVSSK